MSKGRVIKSKKAGLSNIGKQLANMKDEFGLAFDQIKNVIFLAKGTEEWKSDKGVLMYRKLILATLRNKDAERKKTFIHEFCRPWRKMYDVYKDDILNDDLSFLVENDIEMMTGKSKSAKLPLSDVYGYFLQNDDHKLATLEAYLFHIFKHLLNKEKEEEERKIVEEICEQYAIDEDQALGDTISNIVEKVQGQIGNINGKEPTVNNIAPIVQAILGNTEMQNSMSDLAQGLLSGKTDIPGLVAQVKRSVEGNKRNQKDDVPKLISSDQ